MTVKMEPIAIIGTGCRFPGSASSPSRLWELLRDPKDVVSKPPIKRFNMDSFYHQDGANHGTTNQAESYYLEEDLRPFDAPFFNISPTEAESMDPQQRLLMETVYESLDNAGQRLDQLQGSSTGVFCGYMNSDWTRIVAADMEAVPPLMASGMACSILSNRISYFFDWHGPSLTLDTACSGSLVALHLAAEALRKGDCSMALAAGSSLMLVPDPSISESNMQMLSPTNRSYMWDDRADGYARGEGVASVVLKRLGDAIRDGDKIECVIRASGVNQDGRTMGLTMPNNIAQRKLIRATYVQAGLNPDDPRDRCQYFEAHGTGTPAGDPQEAQAICDSFFQSPTKTASLEEDILYVGSIKTIIGHTEATAGLAGVIKASLAMQKGEIPPNMHFKCLNPDVRPFTSHLRIPLSVLPWPKLPPRTPRRTSVNSFGFGGTNAHVILEDFNPSTPHPNSILAFSSALLPFVFSAASEDTLGAVLEQYLRFLQENPSTDLLHLGSSLMTKRSAFSSRVVLTAVSIDDLKQNIQAELDKRKIKNSSTIVWRTSPGPKKIIGVFTGQGAQWAQMGLDLFSICPKATLWLKELQTSLNELPEEWRPDFSLFEELSKPEATSRLNTSIISLTLRTAMQIIQVNLLRTLGIEFAAVVGHSSGEISAAYAAGVLSASDAIRTAYLRGIATQKAGSNGKVGGMMAVGISWEQAQALCDEAPYAGNVTVAALNSPSSVTLSGDADLLNELEWLLKSLDHSPRRLRVDTAYHSNHMKPCADPYVRSLKACGIQAKQPTTKWFSSVFGGRQMEKTDALNAEYWKDNMLRPVLFSQALAAAMEHVQDADMIVEVGPQPALKGPALQTISSIRPEDEVPYIGLSDRRTTSIDALAAAIGSFWMYLGPGSVDINKYTKLFDPAKELAFVKDLPTYPFDRTKSYWFETRMSKVRLQRPRPNAILGVISPEMGQGEYRWRNYLREDELSWLDGHRVQGQLIFPATGYIVMALEAAAVMAGEQPCNLVEIRDLDIGRAIPIPDTWEGVETLFKVEVTHADGNTISGTFNCQAGFNDALTTCASGRMIITLGEQDPMALPMRSPTNHELQPVDMDRFYGGLEKLGYGYSGPFRALTDLIRKKDISSGIVQGTDSSESTLLIHPATIDTSLHSLFAAIGSPGDGQLTELYVPTNIERLTINPAFCRNGKIGMQSSLTVDADLTGYGASGIAGAVDLFDASGRGFIQIEGIHVSPVTKSPDHSCPLMSEVIWGGLKTNTLLATSIGTSDFFTRRKVGDHIAILHLRDISKQLTAADREKFDGHRKSYAAWMDTTLASIRDGTHVLYGPDHLEGDLEEVLATVKEYSIEIFTTHAIGQKLLPFFRYETTILEVFRKDNLLTDFYKWCHELQVMTRNFGILVGQIAFRFPRMKILEVGAGTGSATREIMKRIGRSYHSYTYTDISTVFFEEARVQFAEHEDRFIYEALDVYGDLEEQGFELHSYDLVVAGNVLHATGDMARTLRNVRKLLKPGGRLAVFENTDINIVTFSFIFGGFEGWWYGEHDGRPWGPFLVQDEWRDLLFETGYNGFETITPKEEADLFGMSVFVTQVVDESVQLLQTPLAPLSGGPKTDLFLVGGATEATWRLMLPLNEQLNPYFRRVHNVTTLDGFVPPGDIPLAAVLVLSDIDSPYLQDLTDGRLKGLQDLLDVAGKLLWVATGSDAESPYASMSKGLIRSLVYENPQTMFQHLTVADPKAVTVEILAETIMQLVHTKSDNDFKNTASVESVEIELLLEDGVMKIPRVQMSTAMNQRLLSSRCAVEESVDAQKTAVRLVAPANDGSGFNLVSLPQQQRIENYGGNPSIDIRVHYSTLSAVRVEGVGFLHLVIGQDAASQGRKLALSAENASLISAPAFWCWDIPSALPKKDEPAYLKDVAAALLAMYFVNQTRVGTTLLVHEPDAISRTLRSAVSTMASLQGIDTRFTTCDPSLEHDQRMLFIHPRSATRTISQILPGDVSVTASVSPDSHGVFSRLDSLLPKEAARHGVDSLYQTSAFVKGNADIQSATSSLVAACRFAFQASGLRQSVVAIKAEALPEHTVEGFEVVDWTSPQILARVQPASSQIALSPNKTYLLVGMTGDLGRSVCRWMVTRGARNVVLTSRSPNIDPAWFDEMSSLGARVLAMAM